jgi:hypothetical protein
LASHATHTRHSTAATTAQTAATTAQTAASTAQSAASTSQTTAPQTATALTATASTAKASELSGYSLGNNARRKNDPELPPGFVCDGYGHPAVASSFGLDRHKPITLRVEKVHFRNAFFHFALALFDFGSSPDRL